MSTKEDKLAMPAFTPAGLGNCGIVSVAILAGVTHWEAEVALRVARAIPSQVRLDTARGQWSGVTTIVDRQKALRGLGVETVTERLLPGRGRCRVRTFATKRAEPGVTYMLRVSGHAFILRDGLVYDQTYHGFPADLCSYRNCLVTHVTTKVDPE